MDSFLINTDYNNQKIMLNAQEYVDFSVSYTWSYNHGLGYIPVVRVWYEPEPGRWRPISTRQMQNASPFSYLALTGTFSVDTSVLEVELRDSDGFSAGCNIWVRVYYDN